MAEQPFASFQQALAVVTGGGDGIGRALCLNLVAAGCSIALCDISSEKLRETQALCEEVKSTEVKVTCHLVDVSEEAQAISFAAEVAEQHAPKGRRVMLLNNAGIASEESIFGDQKVWERTFNVNWYGTYHMTRAFLPMLLASSHGYLVNVSSVHGFFASVGPFAQNSAYATAKFAVKGFTESLIHDFKLNAPHVKAAVVMPGHIGTHIATKSLGALSPAALQKARDRASKVETAMERLRGTAEFDKLKSILRRQGSLYGQDLSSDAELTGKLQRRVAAFQKLGLAPSLAAARILDGVRQGEWRILVGMDAEVLDEAVRRDPSKAYDADFGKHVASMAEKMARSSTGEDPAGEQAADGSKNSVKTPASRL